MLREGNDSRYHTGCPCKGQAENELDGQYQTLDGADNGRNVEELRTDNGGRLLFMMRSTLEARMTENGTEFNPHNLLTL